MHFSKAFAAIAVVCACAGCNNMGCADGLMVISKSTYAANTAGPNAYYRDESGESNGDLQNPDGGGWTVRRDAKGGGDPDHPKLVCVPNGFPVP